MPIRYILVLIILSLTPLASLACERSYRMPTQLTEQQRTQYPWSFIQAIFTAADCELIWVSYSAKPSRLLRELELGAVDVLSEASVKPERLAYATFSKSYRTERAQLFALSSRQAEFNIRSFEDVSRSQWRIIDSKAAWLGENWEQVRASLVLDNRLIGAEGPAAAVTLLKTRKADLIAATDAYISNAYSASAGLVALPFIVNEAGVHLMFNKQRVHAQDLGRINNAITSLCASQSGDIRC